MTGPETERVVLKAMISAAKADGQIDQGEMQKIIGKISADSVTPEEKQFVLDEMARAARHGGLASEAANQAQAAQIYAASHPRHRRRYRPREAHTCTNSPRRSGSIPATVAQLHRMTGVPA